MSTTADSEKFLLLGIFVFVLMGLIVGGIIIFGKKNGNVCSGDSQYNCGGYKNKKDCNEAGPSDVPGGCKWGPPKSSTKS